MTGRIRWPPSPSKYFNKEADDIICSLLVFSPEKRLGSKQSSDIKHHKWFQTLNWEDIEKQRVKPPITLVPKGLRKRSETVGSRDLKSLKGSGDMLLRLGNKELDCKYGSRELAAELELGSEIQLSSEAIANEKSWSGRDLNLTESFTNLFTGF